MKQQAVNVATVCLGMAFAVLVSFLIEPESNSITSSKPSDSHSPQLFSKDLPFEHQPPTVNLKNASDHLKKCGPLCQMVEATIDPSAGESSQKTTALAKQSSTPCPFDPFTVVEAQVCSFGSVIAIVSFGRPLNVTSEMLNTQWANLVAMIVLSSSITFPPEMANLNALQYIIAENEVTGLLPEGMLKLPALTYFEINASPNLQGRIPTPITSVLTFLMISGTKVNGTIPEDLYSITTLGDLDLSVNLLTGTVSTSLGQLSLLRTFILHTNQLEGTLPSQLGLLIRLTRLSLDDNRFSGGFPSQIGFLTGLNEIGAINNQFSGTLPTEMGLLTLLGFLDISNNKFQGTLPLELTALVNLYSLGISKNSFSGSTPLLYWDTVVHSCDYSGLTSDKCARACSRCPLTSFETSPCDSQGFGQKCLPGYYLLPLLLIYAALVAFALKKVSPPRTPRHRFVLQALISAFAIADFATNVAFALNVGIPLLSRLSLAGLAVAIVVHLAVSIMVISHTATEVDSDGDFKNSEFRERVYENTFLLACTVTFCAVDVRVLPFVIKKEGRKNLASQSSRKSTGSAGMIEMGVSNKFNNYNRDNHNNATSNNSNQDDNVANGGQINNQDDKMNSLSAATTNTTKPQNSHHRDSTPSSPVLDIDNSNNNDNNNNNNNDNSNNGNNNHDDMIPTLTPSASNRPNTEPSLRRWMGVLTVVLEDMPQLALQIVAFVVGARKLVVVIALAVSAMSLTSEIFSLVFIKLFPESARSFSQSFARSFASKHLASDSTSTMVAPQQAMFQISSD